jgi:Mitochondrial ribosomal protein subunit
MAASRLSPTANLLRTSRLFALPPALPLPQKPPTSKNVYESDTATAQHPTHAAIVTPASSLARGDWGLKRPLPAKSTSDKSSKPVVRVKALDTFEHVTDFESASDHTLTLQKIQELNMPMSLPAKLNYAASIIPRHQSPFDTLIDNTENSEGLKEPGAKQFRHSGPWLAGQSEFEFQAYLQKVRRKKPELLQKLRERFITKCFAERRKQAQDNGEDLDGLDGPVKVTEDEFQNYLKSLRADPASMGYAIYELLDLPPPPSTPNHRIHLKNYESPAARLSAPEYAAFGPPKTHPSSGLSYMRSHALLYNHPLFGPQVHQRPVEARILSPRKRYKGRASKVIAGVAGIAVEDLNAMTFEQHGPLGLAYFDASVPGGAKYWLTPIRASVDSEGRISLACFRATTTSKAPYGITDYKKPALIRISEVARGENRAVPRLDKLSPRSPRLNNSTNLLSTMQPLEGTEEIAQNLIRTISSS